MFSKSRNIIMFFYNSSISHKDTGTHIFQCPHHQLRNPDDILDKNKLLVFSY